MQRVSIRSLSIAALGLALGLALLAPTVAAQGARSVTWERFDLVIDLLPDGTLQVVETEQLRFNSTHQQGFREIPLDRVSGITEVQVGEPGRPYRIGATAPETFAVARSGSNLRIDWRFSPTTNAERMFELRYRVSGAIRVYEGGDQLWWKAVPAGLGASVQASDVLVRLPQDVPVDQLKVEAYRGSRPDDGQPSVGPREIRFAAEHLPSGQDYEVRVQYPHGLVPATMSEWQPGYDRGVWYDLAVRPIVNFLLLLVGLMILVGGVLGVFLYRYVRGRDPENGVRPVESDAPPGDLPPALVGLVLDGRVEREDLIATLLDLANRGVIRISRTLHDSDLAYSFELMQAELQGLLPYEKEALRVIFERLKDAGRHDLIPAPVLLSKEQVHLPAIGLFRQLVYDEAFKRSLFAEIPDQVRGAWRSLGALLAGAGVFGYFLAYFLAVQMLGTAPDLFWMPSAALLLVALALLVIGSRLAPRTRAGAVEAARWRTFGCRLASVQNRSDAAKPDEIARRLPYAVALGVDRSWLKSFPTNGIPAPLGRTPDESMIIVGPGSWAYRSADYGAPADRSLNLGHPAANAGGGPAKPEALSGGLSDSLDIMSRSLSDFLNRASATLSSATDGASWSGGSGVWSVGGSSWDGGTGIGGGWSGGGGGGGGGWSGGGGGGGGGSGGGSGGFS